jgi:quercetin dioxygenase-like cupin family protein
VSRPGQPGSPCYVNRRAARRLELCSSSCCGIGESIFSGMINALLRSIVLGGLCWFCSLSSESFAHDSLIKVEQLLQTTHSWDGTRLPAYLSGQPQITVLKITVPRNTALDWHQHPMINAGYVLSGQIYLEKRGTLERKAFRAGRALAECVKTIHRGYTTDQPAELIVFYAGAPGVPLSIKAHYVHGNMFF